MMLKRFATGFAAVLLGACSNGGGDSSGSSLSVELTDASVDDVSEIWVQFRGIRLQPQTGPAIDVAFASPLSVDMLTLTDGNTEVLLNGETVPDGAYNWMELQVNADLDGTYDSYVMTNSGGQQEVFVPSGSETGLRLVSPFTVTADQETSFLIDWDMRMGLADAPGQTGYILRPAFRLIDKTEFGTLSGTVAMSLVTDASCTNDVNTGTGNAVYVYEQFEDAATEPDDLGGATGPVPVATSTVKQQENGDYAYSLLLSPGNYTVAFTCQAATDDNQTDDEIAIVLPTDVSIVDDGSSSVDF